MAITKNGSENSATYGAVATSGPLTIPVAGTAQVDALMVFAVAYTTTGTTPKPVQSVTDSQGNTWQLLHYEEAHAGWDTANTVNGAQKSFAVEVWYTKHATIGTSIDITIDHGLGNTIDAASVVLSPKYLGYDATNPFDQNASLPAVVRINTNASQLITGISTTNANLYPLWFMGEWGTSLGQANVRFDAISRTEQVIQQKNGSEFVKAQFAGGPAAAAKYTSVTYDTGSSPTSSSNTFMIGHALTADAAPPAEPPLNRAFIIG